MIIKIGKYENLKEFQKDIEIYKDAVVYIHSIAFLKNGRKSLSLRTLHNGWTAYYYFHSTKSLNKLYEKNKDIIKIMGGYTLIDDYRRAVKEGFESHRQMFEAFPHAERKIEYL